MLDVAGFCAHEFLIDCREFKKTTGVDVVDIAKRLQDYGKLFTFHSKLDCIVQDFQSRVCAVAQYAVLEANGKVNGIGENSNPYPSLTLGPIWMLLQIYH